MKKITAFVTGLSMLLSMTAVYAEGEENVSVYRSGERLVEAENGGRSILSFYDEGGVIAYSVMSKYENGKYSFEVPGEYDGMRMRLYRIGDDVYEAVLQEQTNGEPQATEKPSDIPQTTEKPTETATSTPTRTPVPEAYERALDAANAPAVVTEMSKTVVDGETYNVLTMLYQGNMVTTNVRDWVEIKSAPEAASYLIGKNADSLKEGDVIHFTTDMQGRIKSIEFIYRPEFDDYIGSGASFDGICGKDGYSTFKFGVAVDKTRGSITIADASGKISEVDVNDKAFVYKVSDGKRKGKVALEGTGASAVEKVYISKDNLDDEGNVISWEDNDEYSYVLVRTVNGAATEIIVFGE